MFNGNPPFSTNHIYIKPIFHQSKPVKHERLTLNTKPTWFAPAARARPFRNPRAADHRSFLSPSSVSSSPIPRHSRSAPLGHSAIRPMLARRCSATLARRVMPPNAAALSTAASGNGLKAANLEVHRTQAPKEKLPKEKLLFGKTFTDHMLEVDWVKGQGWGNPVIRCVRWAGAALEFNMPRRSYRLVRVCVQPVRPVLA